MKFKHILLTFVLVLVAISSVSASIYDFENTNEIQLFEQLMIDSNNTISTLNTSYATITVTNGLVMLKSLDNIHMPAIAIPYQQGQVYAVEGKNLKIGVIANNTLQGAIDIIDRGYIYFDSQTAAVLTDGAFSIKVFSTTPIEKVVIYSKDGLIDKLAIDTPKTELSSGSHLYQWSGTTSVTKRITLTAGARYKFYLVQSGDTDAFLFKPSNPNYGSASEYQSYHWLVNNADFKHYIGTKYYTAPESGTYKLVIKILSGDSWSYTIDCISGCSSNTPPPDNNPPPSQDNPAGIVKNMDDKKKMLLIGIGAFAVTLFIVFLAGGRRK